MTQNRKNLLEQKREKRTPLFILMKMAILDEASWIVEGCSFSTFEMRFAHADTLIYFHFSRLLCFWRLFKRLFNHNEVFGGLRVINWGILKYIWNFDKEKRERIEELRKKYPGVGFRIFRRPKDADRYLEELKRIQ